MYIVYAFSTRLWRGRLPHVLTFLCLFSHTLRFQPLQHHRKPSPPHHLIAAVTVQCTMHHALEIVEIVHHIITYCDKRLNARNALVCKLWSEISLDALWYEVNLPSWKSLDYLVESMLVILGAADDQLAW